MRLRLVSMLCLVAILATACGGSSGKPSATPADTSAFPNVVDLRNKATGSYPEVKVSTVDNDFDPAAIRINPGTTVSWHNVGRSAHDILPVDASQDFGGKKFGVTADDFKPGKEYEYRFDKPGVYRYYCSLHGSATKGMIGEIVVGDVDASGGDTAAANSGGTKRGTLRVPEDYPTIQKAVDAAKPGSLVLVSPGVYKEAVTVTTPDLVIRGLDRARTMLDGSFKLDNGIKVLANGVAIENMTARDYQRNGFFWTGVKGYRGSYLTAIRNGDYGIYAFDATYGQFDHDYGEGSPDAGFYIGQCFPCHAVITDSLSEWNGIGYSGTNAGGDLIVASSVWRHNRVGIVPNSGTEEKNYPQHGVTVVGNTVYSNNNAKTAAISIAELATGNGILLAGGNDNVVDRNLVYDHDLVGIAAIPLPEKLINTDDPKAINFDARRNRVIGNNAHDNHAADLGLVTSITDANDAGGNCFSDNTYTTTLPANLEQLAPCGKPASPAFTTDLGKFAKLLTAPKPPAKDYRTVPLPKPPVLPDMPDAANAPARSAGSGVPMKVDVAAIALPSN